MTPDATRAHISIDLDRPRVLCFDHKATFALMQRYGLRPTNALYETIPLPGRKQELRIRSVEALAFFLYIGLQRDAADAGETLTEAQAEALITPLTIEGIFYALLASLSNPLHRKNADPAEPKGEQAGASASPKHSTGRKHFASEPEGSD